MESNDKEAVNNNKVIEVNVTVVEPLDNKSSDDENIRRSLNTVSSTASDLIDIITQRNTPDGTTGVGAVLSQCRLKLAEPYLKLLTAVGLRSPSSTELLSLPKCFFIFYRTIVVCFVICGYMLQYMSCFRRDRGFGYKEYSIYSLDKKYEDICHGSFMFSYILPDVLHFSGYLYAIYSFSTKGDDQLQSLMERVFLVTTNSRDGNRNQKKIVKTSHVFIVLNYIWIILSSVTIIVMIIEVTIEFKWLTAGEAWNVSLLKALLVFCTIWHDVIQATVISNYCLQAQILILYLQFLRDKIMQHPVTPTEWMKEITEFKTLLKYFNEQLATSVSLFTIVNLSWALSGTFWVFHLDHIDKQNVQLVGISLLNVFLWITLSIAPFIQAARLTSTCEKMQTIGHDVRTRPFVHQDTPDYKLDSILLYASTLRLNARLYRIPINGRYLCTFIVFCSILILVLGQLHYINSSK